RIGAAPSTASSARISRYERRGIRNLLAMSEYTALIRDERELHLIGDHAVLDGAPPQSRLQDVTGLLEHAARRLVPRERQGVHARELMRVDRVAGHRRQRLGGDPTAPERFANPVADFRRHALHVRM